MKKSIIYATIRCEIVHPENVSPESVLNDADYSVTPAADSNCQITDTEMTDIFELNGEGPPAETVTHS